MRTNYRCPYFFMFLQFPARHFLSAPWKVSQTDFHLNLYLYMSIMHGSRLNHSDISGST